jgi:hypothetical protein
VRPLPAAARRIRLASRRGENRRERRRAHGIRDGDAHATQRHRVDAKCSGYRRGGDRREEDADFERADGEDQVHDDRPAGEPGWWARSAPGSGADGPRTRPRGDREDEPRSLRTSGICQGVALDLDDRRRTSR